MATDFEKVMMSRDGMTEKEAKEELKRAREEFYNLIESGAGYTDVEDLLLDDYGLEMDYLMDLI
jgi:hypothetical protein